MKTGAASTLNPYAASYVPLVKREVNKEFGSAQELNSGSEGAQFGNRPVNTFPQGQHQNVTQSHNHSPVAAQTAEYSKWKDQHSSEFVASTSQYPNEMLEKPNFDEDFDMDLAYLQMTFPGISEESISDIYLVNKCDLDSAVDMLNQLEKLPDILDIGDVPECGCVKALEEATAGTSASVSSKT